MKALNLEERKPQLLVFWFYGKGANLCRWVWICSEILCTRSPSHLGKVACDRLGRRPLPLGTQGGHSGLRGVSA